MNTPQRFLVVRFGAIGDCIMTSWAVSDIRATYPNATIVWANEDRCSDVIDQDSLVNFASNFPRRHWKTRPGLETLLAEYRAFASLRQFHFDAAIDFQGHAKTAICLRLSGARRRFAVRAHDALAQALNPHMPRQPKGSHDVEWNSAALRRMGQFEVVSRPIMPGPIPVMVGIGDAPLITICISAGHKQKRYSRNNWTLVGQALTDAGYQVLFIGGDDDRPMAVHDPMVDAVGRLSLRESLSLVSMSVAHVAADTWSGHAAAALGIPVVSVFGPTEPSKYRPYTAKGKVLRAGSDPNLVRPDDVVASVLELLSDRHEHSHQPALGAR